MPEDLHLEPLEVRARLETELLVARDTSLGAFVERETGLTEDPARPTPVHVSDGARPVHVLDEKDGALRVEGATTQR